MPNFYIAGSTGIAGFHNLLDEKAGGHSASVHVFIESKCIHMDVFLDAAAECVLLTLLISRE